MTKKSKLLALAGVTLASSAVLAACGSSNSSSSSSSASKTYSYVFSEDPTTLDYVLTARAGTSDVTTNLVDGLLENDKYGNLVPSLAEDWKVSKDGLTYTYTLREGINWYTVDGEEYAPVTAQDFVTGLKHAADKKSDALYVAQSSIKGLQDYLDGKTTDFSTVGVKAIDDRTVQYTLAAPEPYFNSKLTYGLFFPVNAEFLESKGDDFGKATDPSSILYNGAYYLSSLVSKSAMEFTKNPNYWDAENVTIDEVKFTYYDGADQESLFNNFDKGLYTVARLFPSTPSYKTAVEKYGDKITYGMQTSSTYYYVFNTNRSKFDLSDKTDAEKESTKKAFQNEDFRQAITFAFDRAAYSAQTNGEEASTKNLRNIVVAPGFLNVGEKDFGTVATEALTSTYGDEWKDVNLADAQDGLYNAEKAKAEFAKAKTALEAEGVTFPIKIDVPVITTSSSAVAQAGSLKQSVESVLGAENVVFNIKEVSEDEYMAASYLAETADQMDYDMHAIGWTPDYDDASSYLDIFGLGDHAATTPRMGVALDNTELINKLGLNKYQELLDAAAKITDNQEDRNAAYAKAQAWLTNSALIIPTISAGGAPRVSKVDVGTGAFSWSGNKGAATFKGLVILDEPMTTEAYEAARTKWLEEKAKSNAEYAASLADHVE